jgi:hypothetical protein
MIKGNKKNQCGTEPVFTRRPVVAVVSRLGLTREKRMGVPGRAGLGSVSFSRDRRVSTRRR